MNAFDRYFHAPFASARAYLFSRLFLGLVALDTWMLMIGHAGRYGVDGFNVAHFRWLDAIAPPPSAALYIGVLLVAGLLATALALSNAPRPALVMLFVLYTYSWAMSMLDSYQHHYFVSSVLLCLVFFPVVAASDVHPPKPPPAPAADAPPAKTKKKAKHKSKAAARAGSSERQPVALYAAAAWLLVALYALFAPERSRLTWLVVSGVAFGLATHRLAKGSERAPAMSSGFGFNLLGATSGILYAYTSIAKLDESWRDGHTITRISSARQAFAPLVDLAAGFGISTEAFWSLLATSVIPVELAIALTYFVAVRADASESPWPRRIALTGFALAMLLHLGAEAMNLEIGWFSYYMMLFACAFLLPARAVDTLAHVLTVPAALVRAQLADLLAPPERGRSGSMTLVMTAAVALMLGAVGTLIDLPGAVAACAAAALLVAAVAIAASATGRAIEVRPLVLGTGFAAALMWLSIAQSESRWDFYRFLGGDLRRRGAPEAALEAYERGERYAPPGQTRQQQIEELRRELGK